MTLLSRLYCLTGLLILVACQPPGIGESTAGQGPAQAVASAPVAGTRPGTSAEEPLPSPQPNRTGNADVEFVRAVQVADGSWTFHVTVRHPDTGWEDYANGWDVVLPGGRVVKPDPSSQFTRLLLHPHESEQPFTRSQSGIAIPDGISQVTVRAHDLIDGFGGAEVVVELTAVSGPGFEVQKHP